MCECLGLALEEDVVDMRSVLLYSLSEGEGRFESNPLEM